MSDAAAPVPGSLPAAHRPPGHPPVQSGRVGVLLVNLGTPEGTDAASVRRYLAEFLSDRRVIEQRRIIWYPILYGVVLRTRPKRSGANYAKIWNHERNESPLRTYTRAQGEKLAARLAGDGIAVGWAMRYGLPTIASELDALRAQGCDRILLFPLYPQYSATTTATVNDTAFAHLARLRWQPALRTVPPYPEDPLYIDAVAASIERHLAGLDFEPEIVLASYHGLPQSYFDQGDPYYCHCHKTTRLLADRLGWPEGRLRMTFQSRFGPAEWLKPYTIQTVEDLAKAGVKRIAVVNPGFVADCLETLEEIAVGNAEVFHEHGGERFSHVPCLNDGPEGMAVIEAVVRRELAGWI